MSEQISQPKILLFSNFENFLSNREQLIQAVSKYAQADKGKASRQIANTFVPYLSLWALMMVSVCHGWPYWLTLLLSVAAAGFLVRIFILFHDCCHGAFLPTNRANRVLGYITGIMTFTPFEDWRRTHVIHHACSGDLDRRGTGDIWTLTVAEYLSASRFKRFAYRSFRNPILLFTIIPLFLFLILNRFPSPGAGKRERNSVIFTNLAIAAFITGMSLALGFQNYLSIQLPTIMIAASAGMWLFYVQHQYEGVYWQRHESWDLNLAGLAGSSYYKLPKALAWIVGNIGLHHIHHFRANIPNYNLELCYKEIAVFQAVTPLTIRNSLKSLWLNLWDEQRQKLVSFRAIGSLQTYMADCP
jgi:omega-6 fatty acid desaturase (delta-12 desaturase)